MLELCENEAQNMDLIFNCKKLCLFKVGVSFNEDINNLHLNGGDVCWVDKLKYLGIYIVKDRLGLFKTDTSWVIRKFYAAANAIDCHTKNVQELSRLCLFEAFTLPILSYGCDGIFISRTNLQKMNVCWNNVYRKVFKMKMWESVKCLQFFCGRLDFVHTVLDRKFKFMNGLSKTNCLVLKECFRYVQHDAKFRKLCKEYDVVVDSDCLRYDICSYFQVIM